MVVLPKVVRLVADFNVQPALVDLVTDDGTACRLSVADLLGSAAAVVRGLESEDPAHALTLYLVPDSVPV